MTLTQALITYLAIGVGMVVMYGGYVSEKAAEYQEQYPEVKASSVVKVTLLVLLVGWPYVVIHSIVDWLFGRQDDG